jgi:capsular polysaccharide biosynthesis protein
MNESDITPSDPIATHAVEAFHEDFQSPTPAKTLASGGRSTSIWSAPLRRWGVVLSVFLLGFLITVGFISVQEKLHLSSTQVQFVKELSPTIFTKGGPEMDSTWLATEMQVAQSRETLQRVVANLGLTRRWGLGNDANAAVNTLSKMVTFQPQPGTEILGIEVLSSSAPEAAELAAAIPEGYAERRKEFAKGRAEGIINMLMLEAESQDKKTEEKRVLMLTLLKNYSQSPISLPRNAALIAHTSIDAGPSQDRAMSRANESEIAMATKEFESQFALLAEMRERIMRLKVDLELPMIPVLIHEQPYPNNEVARPNADLLLAAGSAISILVGLALAFILEYCQKRLNVAPTILS